MLTRLFYAARGIPLKSRAAGVDDLKENSPLRYVTALLGIAAIALSGAGCLSRAGGEPYKSEPVLTKQALASLVAHSLGSAGVPEPPLARDATRAMRKEYLASAEDALLQLAKLPKAPTDRPSASSRLLLEDQSAQLLEISKLLAVELADAIDRVDPQRADDTLRLAIAYADSVATRSVPDWTASGAVADTLALGIKSVADQLDEEVVERLTRVLADLETRPPAPELVLASDSRRILRWFDSVKANPDPVPVESVPLIAGVDPEARSRPSDEYMETVKKLAPLGRVPHEAMVVECGMASQLAAAYLVDPRGPLPAIDGSRHPIAAFIFSILTPTVSAAADLVELRQENLRLVALTLKIAISEQPVDMASFGESALSPVSGLKFEYVPTELSFDLVRPRAKVGDKL